MIYLNIKTSCMRQKTGSAFLMFFSYTGAVGKCCLTENDVPKPAGQARWKEQFDYSEQLNGSDKSNNEIKKLLQILN